MSRGRAIESFRFLLSIMLERCRRALGRFCGARQLPIVRPANQFATGQLVESSQALQLASADAHVELEELAKLLYIGDRVRIFCDDGVLMAEKISESRFNLIQATSLSELVH